MRKTVTLPAFVNQLDDEDISVRVQAIRSLVAVTQSGEADEQLKGHLEELDQTVMMNRLNKALNDPDYTVQREALRALYLLNLPYDINQLITLGVSQGGVLSKDVGFAMKHLSAEQARNRLLETLAQSDNSNERRFILEMLTILLEPQKLEAA